MSGVKHVRPRDRRKSRRCRKPAEQCRKLVRVTSPEKSQNRTQSKAEWRRWAKATRSQLDTRALSAHAVKQLGRCSLYTRAEHVLTYLAFGNEIDLSGLGPGGKHFYTTRTRQDGSLGVHKLTADLERHRYGFLQPAADAPEVELERLELLLIPGLAFDTSGNRLGYGRGFYDRLLAQVKNIPIVGVVPSDLIVLVLPAEPHDVRMTHLLSEKGVLEVSE